MTDYYKSSGYPSHGNNNDGAQKSPQQIMWELKQLKHEFNSKAQDYERMAKTVDAALTLLEDAQAQKDKVVALEQSAVAGGVFASAPKKMRENDQFVFLIDGSGSMNGKPMQAALGAVIDVHNGAAMAKAPPVVTALWGDAQPLWLKEGDLSNPAVLKKIENGLNSGTDFKPAVDDMLKHAASNQFLKKRTHFVLLSDGDIFDAAQSKAVLETLLKNAPKVTLDIVVMNPYSNHGQNTNGYTTTMGQLAGELQAAFPAQVKLRMVTPAELDQGGVKKAVLESVAERLTPATPKRKAAPQPG